MASDLVYKITADITGWAYFICWTVSFYPQVYVNFKLKSVAGFSIDFVIYNVIGYTCYVLFTCTLYWNPTLRMDYVAHEHTVHRDVPVVATDVAFAIHGLILTLIQVYQLLIYDRGTQRPSKFALVIFLCVSLFLAIISVVCATAKLQWYWMIILAGYVKFAMSAIKGFPQVYLNFKRKSTLGFPISGVLGDFAGGVLSIVQQLIYCVWYEDNKELFGNIPKFLLSLQSVFLDMIFFWQHYVLYIGRQPTEESVPINAEDTGEKKNLSDNVAVEKYGAVFF